MTHASHRIRHALRWWVLPAGVLGLLALCVWQSVPAPSWLESSARAQTGDPPAELDEATYFAVGRLRNELSLTSVDLRALGCDAGTASNVLAATLGWYQTNQASLHTARNSVLAAQKALYEALRTNPRPSDAYFEQVSDDLQDAREALAAVQGQAAASVGASMTAQQRECWAAARENRGVAGALRYVPGLTQQQKAQVVAAQAEGQDLPGVIDSAGLTSSQEQLAGSIHDALSGPTSAVSLAEADVLPEPASVRLEREAMAQSDAE